MRLPKSLVKLLNGNIVAISQVGLGTTFKFTVEVLEGEKSQEKEENQEFNAGRLDLKVLLVEDNEINQQVACMNLRKLVNEVDVANNGREAVERAIRNSYDIILMDRHMPIMDGITATEIIKKELQDECPPIYALTASVASNDKEKCLNAGMQGFLSKPISRKILHKIFLDLDSQKNSKKAS